MFIILHPLCLILFSHPRSFCSQRFGYNRATNLWQDMVLHLSKMGAEPECLELLSIKRVHLSYLATCNLHYGNSQANKESYVVTCTAWSKVPWGLEQCFTFCLVKTLHTNPTLLVQLIYWVLAPIIINTCSCLFEHAFIIMLCRSDCSTF